MSKVKKSFIVFLVLIGLVIACTTCIAQKKYELNKFINSKEKIRMELIEELKEGKISIEKNHYISISKKYDGVAKQNYVRSEKCDKEECVVAFLYSPGFPDEDQYLYYSSSGEELIKKYDENLIDYIKKIKKYWYFVQYR